MKKNMDNVYIYIFISYDNKITHIRILSFQSKLLLQFPTNDQFGPFGRKL